MVRTWNDRRAVGSRPQRPDGPGKVSGQTRYVDDLHIDGMWHAATVRSPHPRARLIAIDPSRALARGDVVCLTAADLPGANILPLIADDWPVLVADEARHVGEPVCVIAAPTRREAYAAAAEVVVSWQPLPPILDLEAAIASSSGTGQSSGTGTQSPEPARVLAECSIVHGDLEAGFQAADFIVEGVYRTGHQEHAYLEPQGMIAIPDGEALEFLGSLQCPYYVHQAMQTLFDLSDEQVRVRQVATGGGFGGKEDYPNMLAAHTGLLARRTKRPIKLVYDRHEDIVATTKRHPARITHRTGVKKDGTLVAMEIDVVFDGGAYVTLSPVVLSRGVIHAAGPYRCPNVTIRGRVLATNTASNGAFRGFGAPQTQFAVERHLDRIARRLAMDPFTFRLHNAYRQGDITPTGQRLADSVSAIECLEAAEQRTGFRQRWAELEAHRAAAVDDGSPQRGIGLSLFWHGAGFTGNGERQMRSPAMVDLQPGGRVRVRVAAADFGQGTEMVLSQIVADAVGVPVDAVSVVPPDTARVPDSGPTVASRTVMIVGEILRRAGARLAQILCADLERRHDLPVGTVRLAGGHFRGPDGDPVASLAAGGDAFLAANQSLEVLERYQADATTFDETTYQGTAYACYGWGCNVVEVDVDPDTLMTTPTKLTMVADVGKAIHPILCAGQVEGGTLQAIAWGYLEEVKLADGRYLNDRLQTYIIPTSMDVPEMDTVLLENPSPSGPFGAKGVGELPMDGGAPAILAAIENATGIVPVDLPATPERLCEDLAAGRILGRASGESTSSSGENTGGRAP